MTALRACQVTVDFGPARILDRVCFAVSTGEIVGLIGPNGAGKTTLVRTLAALQPTTEGRVLLDGHGVGDLDRRQVGRRLAYLPQGAVCHWPLTVERIVALGRLPHCASWERPGAQDIAATTEAMGDTAVAHLAERIVTTLSGGERTRVMLARALATRPEILLADEPVAALDPFHQLRVMGLLRSIARRGNGVVVVLHDLTLAARFCDRLVLLQGGRVLGEGAPATVLTPENLAAAYRIEALHGGAGNEVSVVPWRMLPDAPRPQTRDRAR